MIHEVLNAFHTPQSRPTYQGVVDPYQNIVLRVGIIDSPLIKRTVPIKDPVDPKGVINMVTGKVSIRWIDQQGGLVYPAGPVDQNTTSKYGNPNEDLNSDVQAITLTHPMMWTGKDKCNIERWCGFNFLPPLGSTVIVGFRKVGFPLLLGYLQTDFSAVKPIKLGEIMIKGFGNNYSYYQQLHKMEHRVWYNPANDGDTDDSGGPSDGDPEKNQNWSGGDVLNYTCDLRSELGRTFNIVLDAEDKNITIKGVDTAGNTSTIVVGLGTILMSVMNGGNTSSISMSPSAINVYSTGTINMKGQAIHLNE